MSGAWGSDTWGGSAWGGGGDIITARAVTGVAAAYRENVIRVTMSEFLIFDGLLGPKDGSNAALWSVAEVASAIGRDGNPSRPVRVLTATLAEEGDDGVIFADVGRIVDLTLDRPMTPWPSRYIVSWQGLYAATDGAPLLAGTAETLGAYRVLQPPTVEAPRPSRDFANPQTTDAAREQVQDPTSPFALGNFGIGNDGDYAYDEGNQNLKKRVIRRLVTRKGAFAHLPGYGVGVPDRVKQLAKNSTLAEIRAEAEQQIALEPDVDRVKVVPFIDPNAPSVLRLRIVIRPKTSNPFAFEVPFDLTP